MHLINLSPISNLIVLNKNTKMTWIYFSLWILFLCIPQHSTFTALSMTPVFKETVSIFHAAGPYFCKQTTSSRANQKPHSPCWHCRKSWFYYNTECQVPGRAVLRIPSIFWLSVIVTCLLTLISSLPVMYNPIIIPKGPCKAFFLFWSNLAGRLNLVYDFEMEGIKNPQLLNDKPYTLGIYGTVWNL